MLSIILYRLLTMDKIITKANVISILKKDTNSKIFNKVFLLLGKFNYNNANQTKFNLVYTCKLGLVKLHNTFIKNYYSIIENPQLFLMRKLARFEFIRNQVNKLYQNKYKLHHGRKYSYSIFEDINVDLVISCLEIDSCYLGLNLPNSILRELKEFAYSTKCYGDRDKQFGFYYHDKENFELQAGKQFYIASYLDNNRLCPTLEKIESDPVILAIAAKFLGTPPVHIGTELLWSFPTPATKTQQLKAGQVFHYDLDDYKFIKFFFYLTDVDLSNGAHVCIRGTHKNKKFFHQLIGVRCAGRNEQKLINSYGAENVFTICGKAGFGFVEDAICFHKATPPASKERLLLQIEFAINNYGNLRKFE